MASSLIAKLAGRKTDWRICSSAGGGLSVGASKVVFGGSESLWLWIKQEPAGQERKLMITGLRGGAGVGFSSPVNPDLSIRELPSDGLGYIFRGLEHDAELQFSDLEGLTVVYTAAGGSGGNQLGVSSVFFGVPYWIFAAMWVPTHIPVILSAALYNAAAVGFYYGWNWELTALGTSVAVIGGHATAG